MNRRAAKFARGIVATAAAVALSGCAAWYDESPTIQPAYLDARTLYEPVAIDSTQPASGLTQYDAGPYDSGDPLVMSGPSMGPLGIGGYENVPDYPYPANEPLGWYEPWPQYDDRDYYYRDIYGRSYLYGSYGGSYGYGGYRSRFYDRYDDRRDFDRRRYGDDLHVPPSRRDDYFGAGGSGGAFDDRRPREAAPVPGPRTREDFRREESPRRDESPRRQEAPRREEAPRRNETQRQEVPREGRQGPVRDARQAFERPSESQRNAERPRSSERPTRDAGSAAERRATERRDDTPRRR